MQSYQSLIQKLDEFIRKYYFNKVIKGLLLFLVCFIAVFFLLVVVEYYFYLSVPSKIVTISLFSIIGLFALIKYVIIPLLKMQRLGKTISHLQAAEILGKHFKNVDDKIINVLQLNHQLQDKTIDTSLLEASIKQKSSQLYNIPFQNAIPIAQNKKFIPWLLGIITIIIVTLLVAPHLIKDGTTRLLKPTTAFAAPAPFHFIIDDSCLNATIWQPHTITLKIKGDKIPEDVYINIDGETILLYPIGNNTFSYTIPKINKAYTFYFEASGFQSCKYKLSINYKPIIDDIQITLTYPKHLKKAQETLKVFSDLQLPEGTIVEWELKTRYTDNISVIMDSSIILETHTNSGIWKWEKQLINDASFNVLIKGEQKIKTDTFSYKIEIIKDLAPNLNIDIKRDTTIGDQIIFYGEASDDIGLSGITFHYDIIDENKNIVKKHTISLPITATLLSNINFYFDAGKISISNTQNLRMYIVACDNDIINGSKCAQSSYVYLKTNKTNTTATIANNDMSENGQKLQESLNATKQMQAEMHKNLEQLKNKMLDVKIMDWQEQQYVEKMIEEQQLVEQQMEAIKKRFEEQQKKALQHNLSPELQDKQEAVKKQLEDLINKDLKEQLQKLQDLKNQRNPQKAFEQMQQMEQKNKLFQMNMERIQALIKQLELQISIEQTAAKIDEFITQEEEIKEKTEQGKINDDLVKQQEQIRKDFEKSMNDAAVDLAKKETEAKSKDNISDALENNTDAVSNDMKESSENIKNKNQKGAETKQNAAIQKMKQMSKEMKEKAGGMDMEQLDIDIKATRQLLSNLLRFSFDQENLINKVKTTPTHSVLYSDINKEQARLMNNAKMIKDSLFALSKRVFQIANNVNKETTELELHLKKAIQHLQDRQAHHAQVAQQYAMTNANSLALILNELLENLMSDMSESGGGSGGGSKPKKSKGNNPDGSSDGAGDQLKDIITKQQQLGKGMQQGQGKQQGAQSGNSGEGQNSQQNGNGGQQGNNGSEQGGDGNGEYGSAKELARMAREQAKLRQELSQLNSMLNSKGVKGMSKALQELQNLMDKNESDFVNKRLTRDLLLRQQEIMSKLIEAEKAIREQEQDDSREGNAAKEIERPIPAELKEFMREKDILFEQYKTKPPVLKPFYQKLSDNYLQKVK